MSHLWTGWIDHDHGIEEARSIFAGTASKNSAIEMVPLWLPHIVTDEVFDFVEQAIGRFLFWRS